MKNWSIPVGRVFGIAVRVHLTFIFLLVFVWFTETATAGVTGAVRGLELLAIVFGSVVLHELAHAVTAQRYAVPVRAVVLLPIGGVTLAEDPFGFGHEAEAANAGAPPYWGRELRIALAGPLTNFVLAAIAAVVVLALAPGTRLWAQPLVHSGALLRSLVWSNIFLGGFNLLPAYPLDGGRVLRALLARRMSHVEATRRAVMLGQAFSMLFIFAGLWNTWLMLVGFFLFVAAQMEERTVLFQSVLENVRLDEIMLTDFATLSPADTLEDALHKAVHSLQDDFPVIRGTDLVGVISRQSIVQALRAGGNAYVQSAMQRVWDVAHRHESLASAFRKITARGGTLITVVEDQRLIVIVTLQNLMHSMALLAESRRLRRAASS